MYRILCMISCIAMLFSQEIKPVKDVSLVILGTVQDAGSPQIGCKKVCCKKVFKTPDQKRKVVSLGVLDPTENKSYIFEATPDFTTQTRHLNMYLKNHPETPDGVFLTHAHIGHYTGLMYLGKEAMNANATPVYAMPKMETFLKTNGPWSQLVKRKNIELKPMKNKQEIRLTSHLRVTPLRVPHRDEYSETVGYIISGPKKRALFIPDIDKWEKWATPIEDVIKTVDYAFLDATFFDGEEINTRNISEIPHPFVIESMERFRTLSKNEKMKVYFIHFNHTNPLLHSESKQSKRVLNAGFNIARMNDVFSL